MKSLRAFFSRFSALFHRSARDRDFSAELDSHLQLHIDENLARGMDPAEARRHALIKLGGLAQTTQHYRARRGLPFLETLMQDLRYAARMLAKSPGFTAVAILTLALGIGATTAIFSVVNGVLLNPLSYPHPNQLVEIAEHDPPFSESSLSYPNFLDWERGNHSFQALAAYRQNDASLTGSGEPQYVKVTQVSAAFFPMLGVKPVIGRHFTAAEDNRGAAYVVMLSESLWKQKFSASRDIVGKTITLNGTGYTVVGVVPESFYFCCETTNFHFGDVYTPIGAWNNNFFYQRQNRMGTYAVGLLKDGVTLEHARADMDRIAHNLAAAYPDADSRSGIFLAPLKDRWVKEVKPVLILLLAVVGFVLLIACVNVANLLLARSTARSREFAIRSALGASQRRVVRQLLTESMLLAFAGGALGSLLAWWGTSAALHGLPQALPRANGVGLDGRVLLFALAICVVAGALFGLAPALKTSRPDLQETLKEGGRGASDAKYRTQRIFVIVEMALAVVLLIGAGLAIRSLTQLWNVNPGFNPHDVLDFGVALPNSIAGEKPDPFRASLIQLHDAIAAVPGVEAVSSEDGAIPFNGDDEIQFWIEGRPKPATQSDMDSSLFYNVSPDYLKVMQIPLLRGRFFTNEDTAHAPHVAVIDETFAKKYFPNGNPIGQIVNFAGFNESVQIVGVVGHLMQFGLDSAGPVKIAIYVPEIQLPDTDQGETIAGFLVRTQTPQYANAAAIQSAIEKMNGEEIPFNFASMDRAISDSLASRRFAMILLAVFAGLALILATIGIYGVMSYVSAQRTHEVGIRLALGAQRSDVMRLVLGQAARMALTGVAIGLLAALALTRLMKAILFGVSATDPLTFAGVAVVLTLVALAACYIPARRAMRVDPMVALRYE
ncbi:MAG TPA: ABC transporter permease [Candidatus Acidoferrales bacterium]|nr:ABC transporter permease [Candidatus Acidoferrales bacterium]